MQSLLCLLWGLLLILSTTGTEGFARAGRRVCAAGLPSRLSAHAESHVQPVYQPYLTTCQGHRLCSTYRTIYRVAYRQRSRQLPEPTASCCPGWSRANGHTLGCNRALCWEPCQNGGSCAFPGRCSCPPGWMGRACQTDVDECASQSHGCSQLCINTAGSFHCACWDGFSLAADDKGCQPLVPAPGTDTPSQAGPSSEMKEEMKDLRSRVEALEQVSCSTSPCPVPAQPSSHPGLFAARVSLLPGSIFNIPAAIPAVLPAASSTRPVAFPGPQPFEHNHSPASPPWRVLHPPGWSCWLRGRAHSSPSPCRSSSWCWPPSTTSCRQRMSVQTPSAACPTPSSSWTGSTP
uniref:EGF like domain multiple 7 n=1 Tax=Corvus moneduloides TaxID=1196302 RepID=A0A8U7NAI3_CORMO